MGDLGSRHGEAAVGSFEDGPDHRALLLQRVDVPQPELDLHRDYVRGISLSSKVSMTSPWRRSWLFDRPMPHSNPSWTSRTSSLNRRSEVIWPFHMITPSRRKRTFDPRVITPWRTWQPAMAPILGTRKISRTSA